MAGAARGIPLRQVFPGGTRAKNPQDAVEHRAGILRRPARPTRTRSAFRDESGNPLPLLVGKVHACYIGSFQTVTLGFWDGFYIFRINPEVYIQHPDFSGRLSQLPLRPGTRKLFHNVSYRKQRPVAQHVAVVWYEGQSQPWFLATNLPRLGAVKLTRIFAHRMSIEGSPNARYCVWGAPSSTFETPRSSATASACA